MKRQLQKKQNKKQRSKSRLWSLACIVIPATLWVGATYLRFGTLNTHCSSTPQNCVKESVIHIDQLSLGMENSQADHYSYLSQNTSGALALLVPVAWHTASWVLSKTTPIGSLLALGSDLYVLLQTIVWNGLLTEVSHILSHRPRPFVYSDPIQRGTDSAHYTSFYSGHTSFAAASTVALFLLLLRRRAPFFVLALSLASSEALIFSTAYFRILAGRHFLTDVICGAIAGTLTAWIISRLSSKTPLNTPLASGPKLA